MAENAKSKEKLEIKPSTSFWKLCQAMTQFIQEQVYRRQMGQPLAESLEKTPDGSLAVLKRLPCGLILKAGPDPEIQRTVNLRIFCDPLRFKAWRDSLGPLDMFYMNPYGIEVVLDQGSGRWGIFLENRELLLDPERDKIYELASIDIENGPGTEFMAYRIT